MLNTAANLSSFLLCFSLQLFLLGSFSFSLLFHVICQWSRNLPCGTTSGLCSNKWQYRESTNLTEQISKKFQEKSRICLHCFGLLCNVPNLLHLMEHVMMSSNQRSSHDMHFIIYTTWGRRKDKIGRPVST